MRRTATLALIAAVAAACGQGVQPGSQPVPTPNPGGGTVAPTPSPTPSPTQSATPSATASPTATPSTQPPSTQPPSTEPPPVGSALRAGDHGPAVLALQRSLSALGYWMGEPDGVFGEGTRHAVVALQKVASLSRDGVVGPQTAAALRRGVRPVPRTHSGFALEVDLTHQVVMVVRDGSLAATLDSATGGGYTYVQDGATYRADTPVGVFTVTRRVDGWVHSRLGWLWRPAYFVAGFAVHGYADVPPYPASHGCVRVTMAAMDWLWATGMTVPGMRVWVY